jgi:hypothetical protein
LYLVVRLLSRGRVSQAKAVLKGVVWHINRSWGQISF